MEPTSASSILGNDPVLNGAQEQPTMTGTVTTPAVTTGPSASAILKNDPNLTATPAPAINDPDAYTVDTHMSVGSMFNAAVGSDPTKPGLHNSSAQEIGQMDKTFIQPQLQQQTGNPSAEVVPPGSTVGFGTRLDVGMNDDLPDKVKKLKDKFPFGDIQVVTYPDKTQAILVQPNPGDNRYARLSPSFPEKWENFTTMLSLINKQNVENPLGFSSGLDVRAEVGKRAADVLLDVFADNPVDTAIGVLASLAAGPEAGILATGARTALVGAATKAAATTIEATRGYYDNTFGKFAKDSGVTGAIEGLFAMGGKMLGLLATAHKMAAGEVPEVYRKLRQAAAELGLPDFMPQQISPSEVVRRITARSEALTSMISDYRKTQEKAGAEAISGLADRSYADTFRMQLDDSLEKWKKDALSMLENPNVSFEKAGTTIDKAIDDTVRSQRNTVRALYTKAKEAGSPEYDITEAQNLAKDILTGVTQKAKDTTKPSALVNEAGNPLGTLPVEGGPVRVSETTPLTDIIGDLTELNPVVRNVDGMSRPIDALMAIRRRLYDYTLPDPSTGLRRSDARDAIQLREAIDNILENPVSGDPNVVTLWREANKAQRDLYEVTETARIRQFMKAGDGDLVTNPESMARTLLSSTGRNSENISRIFKIMSPEQRDTIRKSITTELLREPDKILTHLEAYKKSPETWSQLIDPATVPKLEAIGKKFEQLRISGIERITKSHDEAFQTVAGLMKNDPTITSTLLKQFAGQPGSELHRDLRAGIIDYIFQKAKVPDTDEFVQLDAKNLIGIMNELGENGKNMLRFLTPDDLKTIDTVSKYLNIIQNRGKGEVAAAFSAGHAITDVMHMSFGAVHALSSANLIGWAVTKGAFQKWLMGQPVAEAATPSAFLSRFGALLGAAVNDAREDAMSKGVDTSGPGVTKMADGGLVEENAEPVLQLDAAPAFAPYIKSYLDSRAKGVSDDLESGAFKDKMIEGFGGFGNTIGAVGKAASLISKAGSQTRKLLNEKPAGWNSVETGVELSPTAKPLYDQPPELYDTGAQPGMRDPEGRELSPYAMTTGERGTSNSGLSFSNLQALAHKLTGQNVRYTDNVGIESARGVLEREYKDPSNYGQDVPNDATKISIAIKSGVLPENQRITLAHEIGHAIDWAAADGVFNFKSMDEFLRTTQFMQAGMEARALNHTGSLEIAANPKYREWYLKQGEQEFLADNVGYYLVAPKQYKERFPQAAAIIRRMFNNNPQLKDIIQFNSVAGPIALATGALGGTDERGSK